MESPEKQYHKRAAILSCLRATRSHPSADALYQMLQREHPDISLATVYRNLALFKKQGQILSLGTVNGTERFDGDVSPHVHFVCTHCGTVLDLPKAETPFPAYESAAHEMGCRIHGYQLMFSGICPECQKR